MDEAAARRSRASRRLLLAGAAPLCAAHVAIGAAWGYGTASAYLACWLLVALTIATAAIVTLRLVGPRTQLDLFVCGAVVSVAVIVGSGLLLGASRHLTLESYVLLQTTLFLACWWFLRPVTLPAYPSRAEIVPWVAGAMSALVAFAGAYAVAHAPLTLYDSLSYHLYFPARWLQDRGLSIIPTPFSDEAQAYAPANGELWFLWLMLPFHGDLLARAGQLPFALLAAGTLYALARRLGAPPRHAVYPPAFLLLSRPLLEQAVGADVDLICAAMFLASLYLGLVALEEDRRADWILWGVSLGLFAGSKYLALVYTPVFVLLCAIGRSPARMMWALPGIAAFALPWYARNWIVAGSPIYPASLGIAGVTLARGAFDRAAMLNSVFHTSDVRLLPVMAAHAFGPTLFVVWVPAAIVGGFELVRRGWWPHAVVWAVPYVMVPLYWFGLPVNVDSRFLMPAIAPALLSFAFTFRRSRVWNAAVVTSYAAAMIWVVVGARWQIPAAVPWFMSGWLSLAGVFDAAFVSWWVALALIMTAAWWLVQRHARWAAPGVAALVACAAAALAIGGERWCLPSRCNYLDTTSPYVPTDLLYAWRWMDDHIREATVAYTGVNLPYPLTGPHLTNRVVYVNIDGPARWRFHDYDRAFRTARFVPRPPLLATSSGELMPVSQSSGPSTDAVRPRYERMRGTRDVWVHNLRQLRVDHLFISALTAYEIDNVWHDAQGFPIEHEWAADDSQAFRLEYENARVRVFAVAHPEGAP